MLPGEEVATFERSNLLYPATVVKRGSTIRPLPHTPVWAVHIVEEGGREHGVVKRGIEDRFAVGIRRLDLKLAQLAAPAILSSAGDVVEVQSGNSAASFFLAPMAETPDRPALIRICSPALVLKYATTFRFLLRNFVEDAATGLSSTNGRENSSTMYISRPGPHPLVAWPARIVRSFACLKAHQTMSFRLRR